MEDKHDTRSDAKHNAGHLPNTEDPHEEFAELPYFVSVSNALR
jgi:hypothetical protein